MAGEVLKPGLPEDLQKKPLDAKDKIDQSPKSAEDHIGKLNEDVIKKNVLTAYPDSPDNRLDKNPKALADAVDKLKEMGRQPVSNHGETIKAGNDTEKKIGELDMYLRSGNYKTANYESNVGIYGYSATEKVEGGSSTLEYRRSGLEKLIIMIENLISKADDRGGGIMENLNKPPIRSKIQLEEIETHAKELGLTNFSLNKDGILVEKADDLKSGAFLDDLLRLKKERPFLQKLSEMEAVKACSKTLATVHGSSKVGIGEVLSTDFVLQISENKITGARLTLPDKKYSADIPENEQKATDLLDFCFSLGSAGLQGGGKAMAEQYINEILANYPKGDITKEAAKLIDKRPSPTSHNLVRLGYDRVADRETSFAQIKEMLKGKLG